MKFFCYSRNDLIRRAAAGVFILLLLLAAISPQLPLGISSGIQSTNVSISPPADSYDYTIYPPQTKADHSQYESKSVYNLSYAKKAPANDTPTSLQNCENSLRLNCLSGSIRLFANFPQKYLKSLYLLADIPPPSFES
jgi:hypothetical protein